jgi:hypothetical protein
VGWDAAIFGAVKLTAEARRAWLAGVADGQIVDAHEYLAKPPYGPVPVAETLRALKAAALTHLELETTKSPVKIAAILTKDDYFTWSPAVTALIASAFAEGGSGEVVFCGLEGASFGLVQTGSGIAKLADKEVAALDRRAELKRLKAIYYGDAEMGGGYRRIWVLNPFTKRPMSMARSGDIDEEAARERLLRHGFDPDTGEPK